MFSQQNWPVKRKGLFLVLVPQLISLLILSAMYAVLYNAEQSERRQAQNRTVFRLANRCTNDVMGAVTTMIAYTTGASDPAYLKKYQQFVQDLNRNYAELDKLDNHELGNEEQLAKLHHLKLLANKLVDILNGVRTLADSGTGNDVYSYLKVVQVRTLMEDVIKQYNVETEQLVDAPAIKPVQTDDQKWRGQVQQFVICAVVTNLILSVSMAIAFTRGITSRLMVLLENTFRLSSDQSLLQPLPGTDEIARLDTVFHVMNEALISARQKERAVVDNAVDVICSLDKDQRFTAVNPAASQTWGYSPDQLLGQSIQDILLPDSVAPTISTMHRAMEEGVQVSFENDIKHSLGTVVYMLWSVRWSQSEQIFSCVAHDITTGKEIAQLKQNFINMVSHDLRTPLTSIQCGLAMIGEGVYGDLSAEGTKAVSKVETEVERLTALVNELLDLEKLKSGKMNLDYRMMAVNEMLERSAAAVDSLAQKKQIVIRITIEQPDQAVVADVKRLIQLTVNLLSNAIKFSPTGGSINVNAGSADDSLQIEVIDEGPGIDEHHRKAIFDQFYQIPDSNGKQHVGTGLGLSICKAIIDAHGGEIGVEPGPQQGSKFWFKIPSLPVRHEELAD